MKTDAELIDELGGTAKVAALLGYDKEAGGVQRVHNWRTRGIPSKVKVDYPNLFMRVIATEGSPTPAPTEAGA